MQFTMENNQKTIDHKDAMVLEEYEKVQLQNRATRRAIQNTYGPKSPTKKRHQLSGKRSWKNKQQVYVALEGSMTAREFNLREKAKRVMDKIFKERAKQARKHSLV